MVCGLQTAPRRHCPDWDAALAQRDVTTGGDWVKDAGVSLCYFSQLHVGLQMSQHRKFNLKKQVIDPGSGTMVELSSKIFICLASSRINMLCC